MGGWIFHQSLFHQNCEVLLGINDLVNEAMNIIKHWSAISKLNIQKKLWRIDIDYLQNKHSKMGITDLNSAAMHLTRYYTIQKFVRTFKWYIEQGAVKLLEVKVEGLKNIIAGTDCARFLSSNA